jgi:energy-coupling factor transporter ATP-binding protein EcfA2
LIRLEGISFRFPGSQHDTIPAAVHLTIESGEWIALTGANGSGKSVLCKIIAGLLRPTSGSVTIDGGDPADARLDAAGDIPVGIAFQNPDSQFVTSTVAREIRFGMENIGLGAAELEERFRVSVDLFELAPFLGRNPHMLSGGEKQRLLLATVWAMQPRHVVLDEPFSFLDEAGRRMALGTVRRTFHDRGRTVVWATLEPGELALADRVICLQGGRVIYDGKPADAASAIPEGVLAGELPGRGEKRPDMRAEEREDGARFPHPSRNGEMELPRRRIMHIEQVELSSDGGDFRLFVPELFLGAGETLGVTGPSGSGKTTLLLGCSGLRPPCKGNLSLFGRRIGSRKDFPAGRVAFLFQSPEEGFFAPTVREEVALAGRRFGGGRSDDEIACSALARAGLDPERFLERSPFHLSQGEKRLVALASQLALPAELFLLDEPTLFLDGRARMLFAETLDLIRTSEAAMVVASHDIRFLRSLTDSIVEIEKGEIAPKRRSSLPL